MGISADHASRIVECRLKHLSKFVTSGSRGWAEHYSDEGPVFIRMGNLSRTSIDLRLDDVQRVSPPLGAEGERTRAERNDILVSVTAYVGTIGIVPLGLGEAYVNQHTALVRPNHRVVPRWLAYILTADSSQHMFRQLMYGGTKQGIGLDDLKNVPINLPPLEEQQAIAALLDRKTAQVDAVVAKKQRLIERLQEKRQALISHAVTKGLDPHAPMKDSGIEWLKEVPTHWTIRRFRHCGTIPNGQVDPRLPAYRDMVLIAPNHIESETGRLLLTETAFEQGAESGKYVAQKGDVIYSKIRPELQKACIAPERCLCSADMYPITPKPDMVAEYILYNLLCDWFTKYAVLWSDRVAMPKVNRETFGNCFMVVPPLDEQREIVRYIKVQTKHIDKMTDRIRTQITKLQEYRQTLISAAVTGKIDVTQEAG